MNTQETNQVPNWSASSADPSQVSLTITSLGKMLSGTIVFFAVLKGVDPVIAANSWQAFVANIATAVPAGYVVWHTGELVFGLTRKAFFKVFGKKVIPPTADPVNIVNPTIEQ